MASSKKHKRRLIEVHLGDHELQKLRVLAAEMDTRSVRLATILIRGPDSRLRIGHILNNWCGRLRLGLGAEFLVQRIVILVANS